MGVFDTSMYQNMRLPDFVGSYMRGKEFGDNQRAKAKQEKISKAKSNVYEMGPDGKLVPSSEGIAELAKVDGNAAYGIQKQEEQFSKEAEKAKYESEKRQSEIVARGLFGATPENYAQRRASMISSGAVKENELPEQFDKNYNDMALSKTLSYREQLAQQGKERGYDLADNKQKETLRHNKAIESLSKSKTMAAVSPLGKTLTPGEKKADEKYGANYVEYAKKGRTNAISTIEKLKELQMQVAADTGFGEAGGTRFEAIVPDFMRSRLAIERRDDARNFANKTLKALFGGQLSDGERKAAAREYWNDSQDNESNARRLAGKIKELEAGLVAQDAQAEYFQKYRTLSGFEIQKNESQQIKDQYAGSQQQQQGGGLINEAHAEGKPQTVIQNGIQYNLNSQTGQYE